MKKLAFGLFLSLGFLHASAAEMSWMTDISKAVEQAKAEKKMVLIDFTGSDW